MARVYKNAGVEAAKQVGQSNALDSVAARVESAARSRAASHGSLPSNISTTKIRGKSGVTDRFIALDHPEAENIEFGHLARDGKTWVPGLWIMYGAFNSIGGSG
ncbi:DUF5403 family protein [Leucobacter sp. NPDC058333]|uniref:DUF5403 family protein n=1 Tax=Leucobacter sp. NPDC058333 TaxID=3346450 RepID=UPI003669E916